MYLVKEMKHCLRIMNKVRPVENDDDQEKPSDWLARGEGVALEAASVKHADFLFI